MKFKCFCPLCKFEFEKESSHTKAVQFNRSANDLILHLCDECLIVYTGL